MEKSQSEPEWALLPGVFTLHKRGFWSFNEAKAATDNLFRNATYMQACHIMEKFLLCIFEKICAQILTIPIYTDQLKMLFYACQASRWRCHCVNKHYAPAHVCIRKRKSQARNLHMHDVTVFTKKKKNCSLHGEGKWHCFRKHALCNPFLKVCIFKHPVV